MTKKTLIAFTAGMAMGAIAFAAADNIGKGKVIRQAPSKVSPNGKALATPLVTQDIGAQNAYMGLLSIAPGAKVPKHKDSTEEMLYFIQGGGTVTIDGADYAVSQNDAIYMPANAEVSFQNHPQNQSIVLQVFAGMGPEAKYNTWQWKPLQSQ